MRKGKGVGKHHHSRKAGPFSSAMMIGSQINLFNRKQIIDKQNKLKKLYETTKDNPQTEFYENINYHYTIYQLGDFIELYSLDPTQSFVAKLTQIIKIPPDNDIKRQTKVFIEVERVLKKNELPQHLLDDYGDIISSGEIFPSQQKIYLYVGSIKRKVDILTIQVYGGICSTNDSMYYTRANFDCEKKVLDPDPQEWKKYCVCQRPYNPDLEFVACSKCDNWFHSECVEAKIINGHFMCDSCFGS